MDTRTIATALLSAILLVACGNGDHAGHDQPTTVAEREVLYWYDPMHPEHRFERPGKSPFMDMDLVPMYADQQSIGVTVPVGIQQTMNLRTAFADRGRIWRRIDTVGTVVIDQSTLRRLHMRADGWIESSSISATGDTVTTGQQLFTLYSPALVNAQEELIVALRRGDAAAITATRERLRALGVQREVIAELERTRAVKRALPWRTEYGGIITSPGIREGMFVSSGAVLVEIADLSSVWVEAEVFDRQADWLRVGIPVEIRSASRPGKQWDASVTYIYPELSTPTRTVRVRIPVANPGLELHPGTWTTVQLFAGPINDVVRLPREALINTGLSTRVILRTGPDTFEVREVTPGLVRGDWAEILHGISPGDEIVISGQFLIDSEASLRSGFSRVDGTGHQH